MVSSADNEEAMTTAFTVTVDLREGTTTGISAADRAATIRALADPATLPQVRIDRHNVGEIGGPRHAATDEDSGRGFLG
jgi:3,4-dihydroxy-2-butanone 4-phosphate synthase